MDANTLITAISTVGFPIAACCVMFMQKMADSIEDLEGKRKDDKGN